MAQQRFSLRSLFVVMTASCVAAWISTSPSIGLILVTILVTCLAAAEWGRRRDDNPVGYGAMGGMAATAGLVLAFGMRAAFAPDASWETLTLLPITVMAFAPPAAGLGVLAGL